jgi:hypothetical protein
MSLELGDMVYSSFLDLDNQMEQVEGSDSDGRSLGTFLAFSWAKGATLEEVGISVLKSVGKRKYHLTQRKTLLCVQ